MTNKTVLVIPDLQIPFHHKKALEFLVDAKNEFQPERVVCVGDEWDNCALSRYPKNPDGCSAGDERELAVQLSKPFYEAFPTVFLCESNHRARLYKRAFEAGIPAAYLRDTRGYMCAPKGWKWANRWVFDGVVFEHGDRASGAACGERLIDANHASTVYGHHHDRPGCGFRRIAGRNLYWMNVGCLIDDKSYAMNYNKMQRTAPVMSCGVIVDGVPRVIPMPEKYLC